MEKQDIEVCSCRIIHQDVIDKIKVVLPGEELLYDLAEFFKVFGDQTRVRILCALFEAEMCVCDIAALLGMTQSAISHQLKILKQTRLVKYRREGKVVYYALNDDHIKEIFHQGLDHVKER